ncbi:hypothetical protein [Clostridium sp. YIM B02506]|uniref:hypothetical protein n=1 Tax=Clostridium sp. YIM B02506 TaxID=2910680 RepID=UPI001EED644F|nr:hypothetical protein [Clostridium sp. YIM B02506]
MSKHFTWLDDWSLEEFTINIPPFKLKFERRDSGEKSNNNPKETEHTNSENEKNI